MKEKKWKSEWNPGHHYKKTTCDNCGKEVWVTVDFEGSGHDDWKPDGNKTKEPELQNSPRPV